MRQILIQFDTDDQPSSFDSVVAVDADVDVLLRYDSIGPTDVESLVHGAMFTRGGDDLKNTAIFVGGSNVADAEAVLSACQKAFFGPVRVSLMLDANGCNTTAAAAVVAAGRHVTFAGSHAVVLGGTGPVGQRVAQLLASDGCKATLTSRSQSRAQKAADEINNRIGSDLIDGAELNNDADAQRLCQDADVLIGCGAAGIELIDAKTVTGLSSLKVAIDLNAVPPAGIGGIEVMDKAKPLGDPDSQGQGAVGYGAIGVGGLKMKTHRAAIQSLFESNDKVLDAAEIYAIAQSIG